MVCFAHEFPLGPSRDVTGIAVTAESILLRRPAAARSAAFPVAAAEGLARSSRIVRRCAPVLAAAREETRKQRHDGHPSNETHRECAAEHHPAPERRPRHAEPVAQHPQELHVDGHVDLARPPVIVICMASSKRWLRVTVDVGDSLGEACKLAPIYFVAGVAAFRGEIELVPPFELGFGGNGILLTAWRVAGFGLFPFTASRSP